MTPDSYEDALVEFQELLQFNRNVREINNYIYQCKLNLNLTKKIITDNDRRSALAIIKEAQDSYSRGELIMRIIKLIRRLKSGKMYLKQKA